jgi:hypothetical protein
MCRFSPPTSYCRFPHGAGQISWCLYYCFGAKALLPGSAGWCGKGVGGDLGSMANSGGFCFSYYSLGFYEFGQPTHVTTPTCRAFPLYEFSLYKTLTTRYGDYGKGSGNGRPVTRDHSTQQQAQLRIWLLQAFYFLKHFWMG